MSILRLNLVLIINFLDIELSDLYTSIWYPAINAAPRAVVSWISDLIILVSKTDAVYAVISFLILSDETSLIIS